MQNLVVSASVGNYLLGRFFLEKTGFRNTVILSLVAVLQLPAKFIF